MGSAGQAWHLARPGPGGSSPQRYPAYLEVHISASVAQAHTLLPHFASRLECFLSHFELLTFQISYGRQFVLPVSALEEA